MVKSDDICNVDTGPQLEWQQLPGSTKPLVSCMSHLHYERSLLTLSQMTYLDDSFCNPRPCLTYYTGLLHSIIILNLLPDRLILSYFAVPAATSASCTVHCPAINKPNTAFLVKMVILSFYCNDIFVEKRHTHLVMSFLEHQPLLLSSVHSNH